MPFTLTYLIRKNISYMGKIYIHSTRDSSYFKAMTSANLRVVGENELYLLNLALIMRNCKYKSTIN